MSVSSREAPEIHRTAGSPVNEDGFAVLREGLGQHLTEVIQLYEKLALETMARLREEVDRCRPAGVVREAHKLRGASLSLRAESVAIHCLALETLGEKDEFDRGQALLLLPQLELVLRRTLHWFQEQGEGKIPGRPEA